MIIALAGNKIDLEAERVVSYEEGKNVADKFGNCIFFETSAKDGTNIDKLFDSICHRVKDKMAKKTKESKVKNPSKD